MSLHPILASFRRPVGHDAERRILPAPRGDLRCDRDRWPRARGRLARPRPSRDAAARRCSCCSWCWERSPSRAGPIAPPFSIPRPRPCRRRQERGQGDRESAEKAGCSANPDLVTLDEAGQKRIGLAFGQAVTRRIILPVRAPGTVAFDERRVTHLKPRTQGRVLSLAVQPVTG